MKTIYTHFIFEMHEGIYVMNAFSSRFIQPLSQWSILVVVLLAPNFVSATSSYPQPANIRVTNLPQLNNEEQTAISPVDTNVIVSVWRDFRLGYRQIGIGRSIDGGQTWTSSLIPLGMQYFFTVTGNATPGFVQQSDPTLVVDRLGNFYISAIDYMATNIFDSATISFYKSIDAGASWSGPVPLSPTISGSFEDKQFTAIDNSGGPHDGNFYAAWGRFPDVISGYLMFIRSTDGLLSFDDAVILDGPQTSSGCGAQTSWAGNFPFPVVDANSDVHVFYFGVSLDSSVTCDSTTQIRHVVSADAGVSFTSPENILPVSGKTYTTGGVQINSNPVVDVDRTAGPFAGRMYLCYTNIGSEDFGRSDVDFMISDDNAVTWSSRVKLNDDVNSDLNDSFHPWLVVNEEGVVIVIFYDNRLDPPFYDSFDLFATYSFDGGATFTANHRITTVSSSTGSLFSPDGTLGRQLVTLESGDMSDSLVMPLQSPQAGTLAEYIGLSAVHDKISAAWTDTRDGNSEVYNATWYLPLIEPTLLAPDSGSFATTSPAFMWVTSWKSGSDQYRLEIADDVAFTNILETRVIDTNFVDAGISLSDGQHFWRVKAFNLANSDSSEYSSVREFLVDNVAPPTPSLLLPTDAMVELNPKPTFDWTDVVDGQSAVTYTIELSTDVSFPFGSLTTTVTDLPTSDFTSADSLSENTSTFWRVSAVDGSGNASTSTTFSVIFHPGCCLTAGDYDNNGSFNIADVTAGIARIFSGGPAPFCQDEADSDGNNSFNIADVTYGIARIFSGGPAPICGTTGD